MSATQTTRPANTEPAPMGIPLAGSQTPAPAMWGSMPRRDTSGRDQTSPQAKIGPAPSDASPAGSKTGRDQASSVTQTSPVSATNFPGDHTATDGHKAPVAGEQDQPTAKAQARPTPLPLSADDSPPAASGRPAPIWYTPQVGDPFLALAADVVDDLEKVRTANENRLRQLTRSETDTDGEERGFGLTAEHPDVARLAAMVAAMMCDSKVALALGIEKRRQSAGCCLEHDAIKNLERLMRKHPLGPWVKANRGVGEKQAARLLAAIGDPYIRPEITRADGTVEPSRPRTVSELWAYCGLHVLPAGQLPGDTQVRAASGNQTGSHPDQRETDAQSPFVGVAPKRQKGQRANWSTVAKTRAYLVAESCLKQRTSPFRIVYDDTRAKYTDAIHKVPCARCGPSGKPAPAGSPLSDGHKHARAMRAMSKAVLKELWREAKRLHEGGA